MSVTIADLVKLPSLRDACVVAGAKGMNKAVASISVLEYANAQALKDELFYPLPFEGGEVVISALICIKDDPQAQLSVVKKLCEGGEAALILYYVGIYLKELQPDMLEYADTHGFPIICMPLKQDTLRYSEVIMEVSEKILQDQMINQYFVSDMLDTIAQLPAHQRSMDTLLRMLSDRLRCTVLLLDHRGGVLHEAAWPRGLQLDTKEILSLLSNSHMAAARLSESHYQIYSSYIKHETQDMRMLLIREHTVLPDTSIKQAQEIVQLFVTIWSQEHGNIQTDQLITAILNDEPVKMRRLADMLHVNVSSIHCMYMVTAAKQSLISDDWLQKLQNCCEVILKEHYHTLMIARKDAYVLMFAGEEQIAENEVLIPSILIEELNARDFSTIICGSTHLENTAQVRSAYIAICDFIDAARIVYPHQHWLPLQKIQYARECQRLIGLGEEKVQEIMSVLTMHNMDSVQQEELLQTLCVYLLDADMNMQRTAELLFLHKNTIKYRIRHLKQLLHSPITAMPDSAFLYQACALYRILNHRE